MPYGSRNSSPSNRQRNSGPVGSTARTQDNSVEARIGKHIKPQTNGCWLYNGKADRYGTVDIRVGHDRMVMPAHRWVYETLVGPIPDGMVIHHTCETPGCVNPAHLMPLTHGDHKRIHADLKRGAA